MHRKIVCFLTLLCLVCLFGCTYGLEAQPNNPPTHFPRIINGLTETWSQTNIYAGQDDFNPMMVANSGKVFLLASIKNEAGDRIICLNAENGDLLWQNDHDSALFSTLVASTDGVYVGYNGIPRVVKYNINTGEIMWSRTLPGRGLQYLFVFENGVNVITSPEKFYMLNSNSGEVVNHIQGKRIFISTDWDTIIHTNMDGLQSLETSTGTVNWSITLDRELRLAPVFTRDIIYVRTGNTLGSVYAIQRSTGVILWKTDDVVVSNPVISPYKEIIYVLTRNGELWQIEKNTGEIITLIEFSDAPFILNGEEEGIGGYELAYDETIETLLVLLGDSRQLFSFQE